MRILESDALHYQDLRREATKQPFESSYSIQEVALSLHESWETLKRYTHPRPEDVPEPWL